MRWGPRRGRRAPRRKGRRPRPGRGVLRRVGQGPPPLARRMGLGPHPGKGGSPMKVHELKPAAGSHSARRRVGRGIAGKGGKTAGRGTKGQGARDTVKPGFEGGQLPLTQRIPKLKGFKNPFRVEYVVVNLDTLEAFDGEVVSPETLRAAGLVHKHGLVKVLGRGTLSRKLAVSAHAFSETATRAIEGAGGTVTVLPPPFGHGRPPAKGNALTNR